MSTTRKLTYITLAVIGFLMIILATASFMNFSFMREKVSQQIFERSHYKPAILGDIYWSFLPTPKIKLQNIIIANKKPNSTPLAKADSIELYPEILPLLSGHFKIKSVAIHELSIGNLVFKNVQATINIKNNLILLHPLTANFCEGNYEGQLLIDLNDKKPKITLNGNLSKANARLLLKSLINNGEIPFSGTVNIETAINFTPDESEIISKNINGNTKITVADGILYGMNIPALIQVGSALFEQGKLPTISHLNQTHFDSLHGSFQIHQGTLWNQDLMLRANELIVRGHGQIDLPHESMNYYLNAGLTNHTKTTPIHIQGPFSNLQLNTQLGHIDQKTLIEKTSHLKEKIKEKIKQFHLEALFS